jgi:hypothetical protein
VRDRKALKGGDSLEDRVAIARRMPAPAWARRVQEMPGQAVDIHMRCRLGCGPAVA